MTAQFMIFAEDRLCFRLATELADRVLAERAPDDEIREAFESQDTRDGLRAWGPIKPKTALENQWTSRADLKQARGSLDAGIKKGGKLSNKVLLAQRAYQMALDERRIRKLTATALVIALDLDGKAEIHSQMRQALGEMPSGGKRLPVVLALPDPESNAWVVAGFVPCDARERDRHKKAHQILGFDPVHQPHRLNSTTSKSTHGGKSGREAEKGRLQDAKELCEELLGESPETGKRGASCWLVTPLEELEKHAAEAGLARFVAEVLEQLVPVLRERT